jgi:hypothetical protein
MTCQPMARIGSLSVSQPTCASSSAYMSFVPLPVERTTASGHQLIAMEWRHETAGDA